MTRPPCKIFVPALVPALAQDISGRIVAYDLLSGSMLGVLALASDSVASATTTKPGNHGAGAAATAKTAVQKNGVVWAGGGNYLAAAVPAGKPGGKEVIQLLCR